MPVNVSSTEPSIHTARDCVGNREKRARLVAFLDGADRRGGGCVSVPRYPVRIRASGRYRPAGVRERVAVGYFEERGRPPADRGDPLEVLDLVWLCFYTF